MAATRPRLYHDTHTCTGPFRCSYRPMYLTLTALHGTTPSRCTVVESKVIDALVRAAERQAARGEGVLSTVGVGDTLALGR